MEINQREIVAVQLRQGRRGPVLSGFAREALAPRAVTVAGVAQPEELRRALTAALQQARTGRMNLCVSIFSETMDAREVRYPAMPERELLSNIQWDLQQLFGGGTGSQEERLLDVEPLPGRDTTGPGTEAPDNKRTYFAVSAPKRVIYEYLNPLHEVRIFPEIVDVGAFSLPLAVPRGGGVGYLHLGPALTHFVMLDNGVFELQRQAGLDLEPILSAANQPGAGPRLLEEALGSADAGIDTPVGIALTRMMRWVDETLEYIRVQRGSFTVEERMQTLVVSGPGATVPGMTTVLGQQTGLQTVAALPPLLAEDNGAISPEEAPAYALALALAQRGLSEL